MSRELNRAAVAFDRSRLVLYVFEIEMRQKHEGFWQSIHIGHSIFDIAVRINIRAVYEIVLEPELYRILDESEWLASLINNRLLVHTFHINL
jgi:hypothetical protein